MQKGLMVSDELYERVRAAAEARAMTVQQFLENAAGEPVLLPHRRELVERFLAWWEGDRSNLGCSVKVAVAKLAGMEWVIPEIEAQRPVRED